MRLEEKVAIITGSSRGIGRELAIGLAREGARVVVNYHKTKQEAEEVVREIRESGGQAFAVCADVSSAVEVERMVGLTVEKHSSIDILVNNAAIVPPRIPWFEITEESWDRVMAVNLKGCWLCARAVFPYMKAKGRGKIINVTSVVAWRGHDWFPDYVASKAGIVGFTRALARQVGQFNINVNAVAPGAVENPREKALPASKKNIELIMQMQCIKRRVQYEDLVGVVVFLASDESAMITGQTIVVDGGLFFH